MEKMAFLTFLKKNLAWTDFQEGFELDPWYLAKSLHILRARPQWKNFEDPIIFHIDFDFFCKKCFFRNQLFMTDRHYRWTLWHTVVIYMSHGQIMTKYNHLGSWPTLWGQRSRSKVKVKKFQNFIFAWNIQKWRNFFPRSIQGQKISKFYFCM